MRSSLLVYLIIDDFPTLSKPTTATDTSCFFLRQEPIFKGRYPNPVKNSVIFYALQLKQFGVTARPQKQK